MSNPPNFKVPMMLDLVQVFGLKKAPNNVTINAGGHQLNHKIFFYDQIRQVCSLIMIAAQFSV
jgi:hypothetical protein